MKIIIVPDSFKGTLTSFEVCEIGERTIKTAHPEWDVQTIPMADGGEGTLKAYLHSLSGAGAECKRITETVTSPVFDKITACYGLAEKDGKKEAIVELAEASGLTLVPMSKRDPLYTTSYGTGELIKSAARTAAKRITVGIGGSATNDGGVGMAAALGVKFYDKRKKTIPLTGGGLSELSDIDISGIELTPEAAEIIIASDVTNPLCGKNGATMVFGPQKGADAESLKKLEENMMRYACIIKRDVGVDVLEMPGGGAAGGVGSALMAFFGGKMHSGAELLLRAAEFDVRALDADFVITGEGKLDNQSLCGKLPAKVADVCISSGSKAKIIAVAGKVELDETALKSAGFYAGFCSLKKTADISEIIASCRTDLDHAFKEAVLFMEK